MNRLSINVNDDKIDADDNYESDISDTEKLLNAKSEINSLIDDFVIWQQQETHCSLTASLTRTINVINTAINNKVHEIENKVKRPRHQLDSAVLILSAQNISDDIKLQALKLYHDKKYEEVCNLISADDMKNRERPHQGKIGPDDSFSRLRETAAHIDCTQLQNRLIEGQ